MRQSRRDRIVVAMIGSARSKKALLLVLAGLLSVAVGFAVVERAQLAESVTRAFVPPPQQVFGKDRLLVLVEGLDYDWTDKDEPYSTASRSDVIMAIDLDFPSRQIYELSVPRDMAATMPDGSLSKINEAQSQGGVAEARRVIAQWLGIPGFDKYVVLRIDATKDLIDAIGGVDVYVKNSDCLRYGTECTGHSLDYDDNWGHLHIHLKEGLQHLDGAQAVAYARFRHDWCSDPCRIMRQQQVIRAIVDRIRSDKLNTLMHVRDILGVVRKDVVTDFTDRELLSLAVYFDGITPSDVHTAQVPYVGDEYLACCGDAIIPDEDAKARLVREMLLDPPQPLPSPDPAALAAIAPQRVTVNVLNGSGIDGEASRIAARLQKAGFIIGTVGDATRGAVESTQIRQHGLTGFAGARVREALPRALRGAPVVGEVEAGATPAPDVVTVIIGRDVATIHGSASAGG